MNKEEWLKKGYVAEPVDKTLDLKAEINKLREECTYFGTLLPVG